MDFSITIAKAAEWILQNRRGKAFRDYTFGQIVTEITNAIEQRVFTYSLDKEGNLQGIVCGKRDDSKKEVHICSILTLRSGIVKDFMAQFLLCYPQYSIGGLVGKRQRLFKDPIKLHNRL